MVTLLCGSAFAASADDGRKILMLNDPPTQNVFNLLEGAGITVLYDLSLIDALTVQLPPPLPLGIDPALALLQTLINQGVVLEVIDDVLTTVDPICPTTALPPASESYRWGPQQIKVPAVAQQWSNIKGSAEVTVAVLDTGIASHPELSGRTIKGYNAITGTASPFDGHGHGTAMAGIIVANQDLRAIIGVAGVEPRIKVAAVKVLDDKGAGYLSSVIDGMGWVFDHHDISLVNMSFGFTFSDPSADKALMKAVQKLYEAGIIMVASAGNRCSAGGASDGSGGDDCGPAATCNAPLAAVTSPATYESWVIAVGATAFDRKDAAYSLPGTVWAPGGEVDGKAPDNGQILSLNTGGGYGRGYGTSHAAAHVCGAAALALQLQPGLSFAQVKNLLRKTGQGAGLIDVEKMIEQLLP
jgi:Subtilase family